MTDTMNIDDYLAQGGVLTNPVNVPARYRGELLRLMASFVDSELAGAAGFAGTVNDAPAIRSRIAAARMVQEKLENAARVLSVMSEFGASTDRYENAHDWAARAPRDAEIGAARQGGDMRLSVFHYPLQGWVDAVTMNVLMGLAAGIQMRDLTRVSYAPLAEVFREIAPREARHTAIGVAGLKQVVATPEGRARVQAALDYWRPRVAATFGTAGSARFDMLKRMGLRHSRNEDLLSAWEAEVARTLAPLGLN